MLKGFDKNGNLKDVIVSEDGELLVKMSNSKSSDSESDSVETTLYAGVMTLGAEEQTIGVGQKITLLSIANYSETADVFISVDDTNYTVGANMVSDLPINKHVEIIGLSATEADTKIQYVIKRKIEEKSINLQTKEIEITENGENTYSADAGYDGLESIKITTNVNGGESSNQISLPAGISFSFSKFTQLPTLISDADTSNITDMSNMFSNCPNLTNLDLSSFNTSNVTSMARMFTYCSNLTSLNLSGFNTSNVTDMSDMFSYCSNLTSLNIRNFDMSNVSTSDNIFSDIPSNCEITTNASMAQWLNENYPDFTNIVIVEN